MKRLAMAATFALAFSIGGWGQAAALADDSTVPQAADVQAAGEAGDDAADSPGSEPPAPEDPDDGEEGTDPGGDENASDPGDGGESTDPDEGTDEPTEDSTPIDASFSLDRKTMPVNEAAEAIPYTITGLKAGDTVTADPGEGGAITVERDGTFNGEIRGNTELKEGAVLDVTVTVARGGQESKTFSGSVEITADDDESDAELSVDPKTQGLDTFLDNGVGVTMTNCTVDDEVTFTVTRKGDDATVWEDTQTAGEDAAGFTTFIPGTGGDDWIGDFVVTAACGDESARATFSVTEDGDESDADLTVTPKTQKLKDFLDTGVTITMINCKVDSDVTFRVSTKRDPDTEIWRESQEAGEDAAGSVQFTPEEGGAGWADEFLVMASCGDTHAETTFTVTDDGSVLDPKLSIDPERISAADFIDRDRGVSLTIAGCAADADVRFEVYSEDMSEKLYEQTAAANEEGAAGVQVYGLGDDPASYVGTYTVRTDCMDIPGSGTFVVTGEGPDGGDGGDSGDVGGSGGDSSMPRTGAELTGLAAGALLILGGAAAIAMARRKNKS